jgi:hypothetical protein
MINVKALTININGSTFIVNSWDPHKGHALEGRLMGRLTRWRRAATPTVAALAVMTSACASNSASGGGGDY